MNRNKIGLLALILLIAAVCLQCTPEKTPSALQNIVGNIDQLLIDKPEHGYVTNQPAFKWEEAMLTGNGTLGALVMGYPLKERIIFSHEKLYSPENPPTKAPDLGGSLEIIREMILKGEIEKANQLSIKLGKDVGIGEYYWTDPFVPACQMEIEVLDDEPVLNYSRAVNYETGEAATGWTTPKGKFSRTVFSSRRDGVIATKFSSEDGHPSDFRIRLSELPAGDKKLPGEAPEFVRGDVIEDVIYSVNKDGILKYTTLFTKKWDGSLKGFTVETRISGHDGKMRTDGEWLYFKNCSELTLHTDISLSFKLPVSTETSLDKIPELDYQELLQRHAVIQGEMFNRFSLSLGGNKKVYRTPDELIQTSSFGKLNNDLVVQLLESARYIAISSTGELPPSLVGIWGGTWRPEWAGDFTQNGNVQSALAGGLNTNFPEIIEAYANYMWSMMADFRDNAHDLFGAPGIFVPSRTSDFGKTYHYGTWNPHLFWFSGGPWVAQIFYDYWLYTGNEQFLKERAIPFMLAAADFMEFILTKDEQGRFMVIPSYSPENGPFSETEQYLAINATMDIASLKQLLRNLLYLVDNGLLESEKVGNWKNILTGLPPYEIDSTGDLKEWIWPGLKNNNRHRHASHLYPLLYEPDPDFFTRPELKKAAETAIENRLIYRREKKGAEMAFGLVQLGLAAAHIQDVKHAYECVDWLCNSYWSPAFTAYHDPGRIFNVDICGGLPAVVTEMIIQSSADEIILLPALPDQWPSGEIKGVLTRCGIKIDFTWEEGKPVAAVLTAERNTSFRLRYLDKQWEMNLTKGQIENWKLI
jgi:alpha-L-fucosidase 2